MTRAELPEQIETERLVLRVRTVADAEVIFDYASRPEVSYPAGFISHREKLKHLGLDYEISEQTQAPILEACPVVLDCQVDRIIEEDGICHIFAKIIDRLADPKLLDDKGHFKNDRFAPTYFMGDGHQRVYRYLDDRVDSMGSFIKKARKKR